MLGETDPELTSIFAAREPGRLWRRDVDFGLRADRLAHGGRLIDLFTPGGTYPEVFLPLHGAHQAANAATALAAVEAHVGAPLAEETVHDGFAAATAPGRLEPVGTHPLVLLDGAHNAAGAAALRTALAEEFAPRARTLVVGLLEEKDPAEMLAALDATAVDHLICTRPPTPRGLDPMRVAEAAIALGVDDARIDVVPAVEPALARARDVTPEDGQIVVTGSLYVVGAARATLRS